MPRRTHTESDPGHHVAGTFALLFSVGAVILAALWVGTAGNGHASGPAGLAGVATVVCLAASIACFAAADRDRRQ